MSKGRLIITAVVLEGRSKGEAARDYDVSCQWVHHLVTQYRAEGEAAEARSRRPHTSPGGSRRTSRIGSCGSARSPGRDWTSALCRARVPHRIYAERLLDDACPGPGCARSTGSNPPLRPRPGRRGLQTVLGPRHRVRVDDRRDSRTRYRAPHAGVAATAGSSGTSRRGRFARDPGEYPPHPATGPATAAGACRSRSSPPAIPAKENTDDDDDLHRLATRFRTARSRRDGTDDRLQWYRGSLSVGKGAQ